MRRKPRAAVHIVDWSGEELVRFLLTGHPDENKKRELPPGFTWGAYMSGEVDSFGTPKKRYPPPGVLPPHFARYKINDDFTDMRHAVTGRLYSRQRLWQIRKLFLGQCVICGGPTEGKERCALHLELRKQWRKKRGRRRGQWRAASKTRRRRERARERLEAIRNRFSSLSSGQDSRSVLRANAG